MKKAFEPEWGNESLRNIVEVEFPEPVSLMPSTPGWWLLLFALIGLLSRALWRRRQRYLHDRYRRDALAQLAVIEQRSAAGELEAVRELAPLIRATAIAAHGRDLVSGLEGEAYAAMLAELSPGQDSLPVADLQRLAYAPLGEVGGIDLGVMIAELERWIRQHKRDHA